jgi:hypothetical protein
LEKKLEKVQKDLEEKKQEIVELKKKAEQQAAEAKNEPTPTVDNSQLKVILIT